MAEHVLNGTQITRVAIGQRSTRVAQRVVRDVRPFDIGGAQVAVHMPDAAAAQSMATGEVAVGDNERLA